MTDWPPELNKVIEEGRRITGDLYWNGGGAVCGRHQAICPVMYTSICARCGHPISWHRKDPK